MALFLLALPVSAGSADERERARADRIDLQIMENRLRSLNFHDQQQRYREQDRRDAGAPMPRPEVPIMRPRCAPATSGSRLSGC